MKAENIARINELWRSLPALREEGSCALDAAEDSKDDMGAVNWGDLFVSEVGIKIDERAEIRLWMLIEEASPEAELCRFVHDYLARHQFPNVEVSTEW